MRFKVLSCLIVGMLFFVVSCSGSHSPVTPNPENEITQHAGSVEAALNGVEVVNSTIQSVKLNSTELLPWGFMDMPLANEGEFPIEIGLTERNSEIILSATGAILKVDGTAVEEYHGPASRVFKLANPDKNIVIHIALSGDRPQSRDITIRTIPTVDLPIPENAPTVSYTDPQTGLTTDIADRELLVAFRPWIQRDVVEVLASALDCELLRELPNLNVYRLRIPKGESIDKFIDLFESSSAVRYAEINCIRYPAIVPDDTYESYEYENGLCQMYEAWDIHQGDTGTTIGIIDTGAMRDHPDLYENIVDGEDFINPIGDGLGGETPGDGQDNNNDGYPDGNVGHGTHVSGIAGGRGNNSEGISGHSWFNKIMPLRVFPTDGDSGASDSSIIEALMYGADQGCVGLNMSLGANYGSQAEGDAVNYAWNAGSVIIAAAGNSNSSGPFYPAQYPNVISVAATDNNDEKASFSNYGSTVDCSAPGVTIMSSIFYTHGGDPWSVPENQRYEQYSGTSMASPQVTGLVGLLASYFPTYTNAELADQVIFTTDNIDVQNPGYVGMLGTGRINDYSALTKPLSPDFEIISLWNDDDNPLFSMGNRDGFMNPGEVIEFQPTVRNTGMRSAPDCVLSLDADPSVIEVLFDSVDLGDVDRNAVAVPAEPLIFRVNSGLTDDLDVDVNLVYSYSNGDPIVKQHTIHIKADKTIIDTVNCSGQPLIEGEFKKGMSELAVLEFNIEADTNYATLEELTVHQTGTAGPQTFTEVQLWLDSNEDGFYTPSLDTRIAWRSYDTPGYRGGFDDLNDPMNGFGAGIDYEIFPPVYFNDIGIAHFTDCIVPTSPGIPRRIFVVVGILPAAVTGETVQIGILSADDVIVKAPDVVSPLGFPIQTDELPIIGTWLDPQQLTDSTDAMNSWRAETAVCPVTGNVYVVFDSDRDGSFDPYLMRSTDQAETFEPAVKLDDSSANEWYPDVQVDSAGVVHVVYYSTKIATDNRELYYTRSFDYGVTFETPVRITDAVNDSRIPKLAVGPGDSINVAWHDDRLANNSYDIYYKRSDDGGDTWGLDVNVANMSGSSEEVAISVGGDGVIHVTWERAAGGWNSSNVFYSRSVDDGLTWSAPFQVTTGEYNNNGAHSDVDADDLGNAYIVFHYMPDANYAEISVLISHNSGADWDPIFEITNNGVPDSRPAIHVNPDSSFIDIVFRSRAIDTWDIFHTYSKDGLATWEDPVQISYSTFGDAREPVVVRAPNKNIFAFWEDLSDPSGSYNVFWNRFIY